MNLKHPYEKHLAEKLVQLPPPGDPDQNWQRMKAMLDEDMPRGGGLLGGNRWMLPAVIILAIGSGIWFGGRQFLPMNKGSESMAGTINKTHNNKPAGTTLTNEQPAGDVILPESNGAVAATVPDGNVATSETNQKELMAGNGTATTTSTATTDITTTTTNDQKEFTRNKGLPETDQGALATSIEKPKTTSSSTNKINADRKKVYTKKKNNRQHPLTRKKDDEAAEIASIKSIHVPEPVMEEPVAVPEEEEEEEENRFVSLPSVRVHKPSVRPTPKTNTVKESPVDIIVDYTGTAVIMPAGVLQKNYTFLSPVQLFPDLAVQSKSARRKSGRSYEARSGRTIAIGLSLPLGFPLGDQEPLAYNRHAGANTISDYIPSPHIQYHLNNRTYFQTQVQLSQPQFIRPILLYQDKTPGTQVNTFIYHSIYARKLYYFNLPVSVYHSPLRNFYMGTGLQFSSMLSGVALTEQRRVSPGDEYIINQTYSKFGNDSLSRRFNNNEVRLLLDMNYYWNRFTVGLQYNQAFNNYVSFQVNPTSPYIFDKNKSLQFYLRYNIWEDRKRKRKSETLLSLK